MNTRFLRIYGGAAAALAMAIVVILPATSWIARQQLMAIACGALPEPALESIQKRSETREANAAARNPGDFQMQLANAIRDSRKEAWISKEKAAGDIDAFVAVVPLNCLETRFGNEPSLYAAILRRLSNEIHLEARGDDAVLRPHLAVKSTSQQINSPVVTEQIRAASIGEKLDPNNSFFRMEKAAGLFAVGSDDDACAAMIHAAAATRYEDYTRDETAGAWALMEQGNGEPGALPRLAVAASTQLPHYALFRAVARATAADAIRAELAGNREKGFLLRRALLRVGARMRVDSSWMIGNLVGAAIAAISEARPGGEAELPSSGDTQTRVTNAETHYVAYLKSIGHSEEIASVRHESESAADVKFIAQHGLNNNATSMDRMVQLMVCWAVNEVLLANLLSVIFLGGVLMALRRKTAGNVVACSRKSALVVVGVISATLVVLGYILSGVVTGYTVATGIGPLNGSKMSTGDPGFWPRILIGLISTSVSIGMLLTFAIRSKLRKTPVTTGLLRSFSAAAVPVVSVLAILYVASLGVTGAREASTKVGLMRNLQHEGRFDAEAIGAKWPGFEQ